MKHNSRKHVDFNIEFFMDGLFKNLFTVADVLVGTLIVHGLVIFQNIFLNKGPADSSALNVVIYLFDDKFTAKKVPL